MRLFKRRDTRTWALTMGGVAAAAIMLFALGTADWRPALQLPLGLAAGSAIGAAICRGRRALPPDVELAWVPQADVAALLRAGAPPDRSLLFVAFERDFGRRYRMDVLIDGTRVGQLRPGTAMLLPLRPGLRRMEAYLDRRASLVAETVNSIPGLYAGFTIRNGGTRTIELRVRRDGGPGPVLAPRTRLVRPAVPEA